VNGIVTDIQRFSVHDGPGIRTTVFLKGCNLRCAWCHNPETLRPEPQLQFLPARCIGCGACIEACPAGAHERRGGEHVVHRDRCTVCGRCAEVCYAGALAIVGRTMTAEAVLAEVLRDRPFYETSGGGMTLSGGEPLVQRPFALDLLGRARREGLHTAVETNLADSWDHVAELIPVTDLWLVDIKLIDPAAHARWTGATNEAILAGARRLARDGRPMIVRTPVVPGVNDSAEAIGAVADAIRKFAGLVAYELLPYHPLGTAKYRSLGMPCPLEGLARPSAEHMDALARVAIARGLTVRVAGAAAPARA